MSNTIQPTVWTSTNGIGEYALSTAATIVDPVSGATLVDPTDSTISIVDTGSTYTSINNTIWSYDEGQ
jgi:hypothetical protein